MSARMFRALAVGGRTSKMFQGHRANHPVKRLADGRVEITTRPAFSVQYHPEASPGPQDSYYPFEKFVGAMR